MKRDKVKALTNCLLLKIFTVYNCVSEKIGPYKLATGPSPQDRNSGSFDFSYFLSAESNTISFRRRDSDCVHEVVVQYSQGPRHVTRSTILTLLPTTYSVHAARSWEGCTPMLNWRMAPVCRIVIGRAHSLIYQRLTRSVFWRRVMSLSSNTCCAHQEIVVSKRYSSSKLTFAVWISVAAMAPTTAVLAPFILDWRPVGDDHNGSVTSLIINSHAAQMFFSDSSITLLPFHSTNVLTPTHSCSVRSLSCPFKRYTR